jgi:hypothetical protein
MPALPPSSTGELLADWLELFALQSADRNASLSDLERALHRDPGDEAGSHQQAHERVELMLGKVARELRDRIKAAGGAYPFALQHTTLQFTGSTAASAPYLFCLFVSSFPWFSEGGIKKEEKDRARRLFEQLACVAAQNYVGGESLHFGSPRVSLPSAFNEAVDELCRRIGEGNGYKPQPSLSRKDDGLDVVAWKHFRDGRAGKLILLGQCATGGDWESKLRDLTADAFCKDWMTEPPTSRLLSAFFIPHRVPDAEWRYVSNRAGIVFDRCRIAHSSGKLPRAKPFIELRKWVADVVKKVAA